MAGPFKCPKCGATTWGELRYCAECGQSLMTGCPQCGGTWRYIYAYRNCPSCGARVAGKV